MTNWNASEAAQRGSILRAVEMTPAHANGWATAVAGTGAAALQRRSWVVASGATASSTALAQMIQEGGYSRGSRFDVINWSRKLILHVRFTISFGTTAGHFKITLGKATADGVGSFVDKGIGIHVGNLTLYGLAHDGSDQVSPGDGELLVATTIYDLRIESLGDGTVNWYLNDVLFTTTAGGPIGEGGSDESCFQVECANNTDSANQSGGIWDVFIEDVG